MKKLQFERAWSKVLELVGWEREPSNATHELIAFLYDDRDRRFWRSLDELDFKEDIKQLEAWLNEVLFTEPAPDDISAYWFGLFHPLDEHDQPVSCLYLAGSNRYLPNEEVEDWHTAPAFFPKGRYADSDVLKQIYRYAHRKDGPETNGEYFCLWYSSIVVAHLCRTRAPALLGDVERRAVAVGFDAGDILMLGKLTRAGFQATEYAPPAVPTVRPTRSDAPFYEIEDDDRGRWWLDEPKSRRGDDLPAGFGRRCERIEIEPPLLVEIDEEMGGSPVALSLTVFGNPIARIDVAERVALHLPPAALQRVAVAVKGQPEKYELLNVLATVHCLDMERSKYMLGGMRFAEPGEYKEGDKIGYIRYAVIDGRRAGDHQIFRLGEDRSKLIVSRRVKMDLEAAGVTGIKFTPLAASNV